MSVTIMSVTKTYYSLIVDISVTFGHSFGMVGQKQWKRFVNIGNGIQWKASWGANANALLQATRSV